MHKLIIQNNKKCQIICSDNDLLCKLRNFLSFKMAGVEYTPAYQNGWDGITFLMSKNGTFSSGLLSKVESFLREHGAPFEVEDRRAPIISMPEIDLLPKLKQLGMLPRDYQDEIVEKALANRKGIARACTGSGKAQPLDAKVLTPDGWIKMGDVMPNMHVIGSDGLQKKVLAVFPQGEKEIFRVSFSDGSSTECCNDHLWFTTTYAESRRGDHGGSVKSLNEIKSSLIRYPNSKNNVRYNHSIPMVSPIIFNGRVTPIDPYLLGVLLGDGGMSANNVVTISSADVEIINYCEKLIPQNLSIKKIKNSIYDYRIVNKIKRPFQKNELITNLRKYDLMMHRSWEKFVPDDYLFNNIETRLAVLQGLMDTDGFVSANGMSSIFYTTSQQLAWDVQFIVQSFGGKAVISSKQTHYTYKNLKKGGRPSYAVHISLPSNIIPFKLNRKVARLKIKTKYPPKRFIDKVELIGHKQAQCILIDSADHLYITDNCILTHNTLCTALIAAKLNKPTIIYVIGLDLLKQFHDLFSELFDEPIGYIGDGVCKVERINIATIWTIGRSLRLDNGKITLDEDSGDEESFDESQSSKIVKMLAATKVHIFDESHVIATDTIKAIYKVIDPERIYGFSGTPFRDDNTDLLINSILGEQIVDIKASRLIETGILARPIIKFMTVPKLYMPSNQYQSIYKTYIVENDVRNQLIIDNIQKLLDKKYTPLVLFKQIKHGETLLALAQNVGIECEMLYGDDSLQRRTEVKEMLKTGKISVLFASTIFDLGIDLPFLNALLLCGGGKSSIRALQRIGRVIRAFPGKKFAAVVDFYDQAKFLDTHSRARYRVYTSEEGFDVSWPTEIKKPRKSKKT